MYLSNKNDLINQKQTEKAYDNHRRRLEKIKNSEAFYR